MNGALALLWCLMMILLLSCGRTESAAEGNADDAEFDSGSRWVLTGELVLEGFYRLSHQVPHPDRDVLVSGDPPWLPVPAAGGRIPLGSVLEPEGWSNPQAVRSAVMQGATPTTSEDIAIHVLTPVLELGRDGRLWTRWTGAADGLVALRGGRLKKGVSGSYHAVEAPSEDDIEEFVVTGLPPARPGSIVLEYSDFVDDLVATTLTLSVSDGHVLLIEELESGGLLIKPGRSEAAR